jgi:hypothetical protein
MPHCRPRRQHFFEIDFLLLGHESKKGPAFASSVKSGAEPIVMKSRECSPPERASKGS